MRYHLSPLTGKLIERRNRFVAEVELDGQTVAALVPTTGRLTELMKQGAQVRLLPVEKAERKLPYDLAQVRYGKIWVSVNAVQANALFAEAVALRLIDDLADWTAVRAEVTHGNSRFDWLLANGDAEMLVEVKSVTLVEQGVGYFPDAPTSRGARHLRELAEVARDGGHASVAFVAQRPDAERIRPNDRTDPDFGEALRTAIAAGVRAYGLRCETSLRGVEVVNAIPVEV